MERGSKLAITKIKKVEPKGSNPFYLLTVIENVYNQSRPYANKWETVKYEAYVFDTSIEFECANFDLEKNKIKYHFENISNPQKSMIRVLDFKFENRTMWSGQEQIKDENGFPKFKPVFYITRFDLGNSRFITEETQIKILEEKQLQLKQTISDLRLENRSLRKELNLSNKKSAETKKTLRETKKELNSITQPKIVEEKEFTDFDKIKFEDM